MPTALMTTIQVLSSISALSALGQGLRKALVVCLVIALLGFFFLVSVAAALFETLAPLADVADPPGGPPVQAGPVLACGGSAGPAGSPAETGRSGAIPQGFPAAGPITQYFGPTSYTAEPPAVYGGVSYAHFHSGLDIGAPSGTPLVATLCGRVIFAGWDAAGYGNLVEIANGPFIVLYGHQSLIAVAAGQQVSRGQVVGYCGSTGNSSGPHVHYEIRLNGVPQNPLYYP